MRIATVRGGQEKAVVVSHPDRSGGETGEEGAEEEGEGRHGSRREFESFDLTQDPATSDAHNETRWAGRGKGYLAKERGERIEWRESFKDF